MCILHMKGSRQYGLFGTPVSPFSICNDLSNNPERACLALFFTTFFLLEYFMTIWVLIAWVNKLFGFHARKQDPQTREKKLPTWFWK